MNHELENIWKEAVMAELQYCPEICQIGVRQTMKNTR
jgi:hypothetical protein